MNLVNATLSELSQLIAQKKISSLELTKFYLNRIKNFDKNINSFITVTEEEALLQAKKADEILSKNNTDSKLLGLPIAHKDIFCTQGIKTSCGSKMLDNFIAPYNATIVNKLNQAGCVSLGKTNMDEFAMGSANENSFYGPVKNPWALDCVSGGSSGGSAAAVAARLVPASTGTDTGGSIRQPAAFCGITGIKPTYSRVSRYGMIAFCSSMDQAGPMAKTALDCALLLQAMSGFDPKDATSSNQPVPNYYTECLKFVQENSKSKINIGIPKEFLQNLSSELLDNLETTKQELLKHNPNIVFKSISLPNLHLSVPVYYVIAPAEASSNLARYDGVRYGYRCENPKDLKDLYMRTRAEGFGLEVKRRIFTGTYVLSSGYFDAYYLQAQKVRQLISNDFKNIFDQGIDLILGPTTPETAFKIGGNYKDPIKMYNQDIFTAAVNLAGLPAISVPSGFIKNKPVSIQMIGNYFNENLLLNFAHYFQTITNWHLACPKDFDGE